jgi:hypothetical protein
VYSSNGCQTIKKFLVLGLFLILFASISFAATTYWKNATATGENHNDWATPTNAYLDDGNDATETGKNDLQDYYNYNFSQCAGALSVYSVEVQLEDYSAGDADDTIGIYVSCNAAGGWSSEQLATAPGTGGAADYIWNITNLGAQNATSGCSNPITLAQLDDSNFRVRIEAEETAKGAGYWDVDWVPVRVFCVPPPTPATTYSAYVSVYNAVGTQAVTDDYFVGNGTEETGNSFTSQQEYNSGNPIAAVNVTPDTDYRVIVQISPSNNNYFDWDGDASGEAFITVLDANKYAYYNADSSATDKEVVIPITLISDQGTVGDDIRLANSTSNIWQPNTTLPSSPDANCEFGNTSMTNDPDTEYHVDFYEAVGESLEGCLGGSIYTGHWGVFEFVFSPDDEWANGTDVWDENVTFNFTVGADSGNALVGLNFTLRFVRINTSLYIWGIEDESEDMPPPPTGWGEDSAVIVEENTWFWANYTINATGVEISDTAGGNCTIIFNDTPSILRNMTWNGSSELWYYNRSFPAASNNSWNISCNGTKHVARRSNSTTEVSPILLATTYTAYVVIYDSRETTTVTDDWLVGNSSNNTGLSMGSENRLNGGNSIANVRGNSSTVYRVLVQIMPEDGNWDIAGDADGETFIHIWGANEYFSDSDGGANKELIRTTSISDVTDGVETDDIVSAEYGSQWPGNTSRPGGECEYGDLSNANDPDGENHVDFWENSGDMETCVGGVVSEDNWLLLEFYFQTDDEWANNDVIEFEVVAGADTGTALAGLHFNITVTPVVNLGFSIAYPSSGCSYGQGCETGGCSACTWCYVETTDTSDPIDETEVDCNGQTATVPFFNFSNTGNVNLNFTVKLNESLQNGLWGKMGLADGAWEATCSAGDGPPTTSTCITLNDTIKVLASDVPDTGTDWVDVWAWGDFVNYVSQISGNNTNKTVESYSAETP